ncbi:MAG: T9SS type A sorting domain-containing protein [Bacteroidetes bacterium]|nr:MAG: T9SS type A sorting domain-containing protein [Bacteroidota bacterium]
MKRYIFISVLLLIVLSAHSQIKQEVIASAGGYNVNGSLSISWTLGETIIPTFTSGNLVLTHGFQQKLIITTVEENLDVLVDVKVFPNPASDVVNIQFEAPVDGEIIVYVLDSQGKLVKRDIIESTLIEKQINLQDLPVGIYYLKLTKGKLSNVYKVVKL